MKVVLVHDYLIQMGGAERVVAALHRTWPEAPIYTSVTDRARLMPELASADVRNTWMQRVPGIARHFKLFFPLYPLAFRCLGRIDADVALVSSSGFAKWARFTPRTRVFCYCHTPPRFFWQAEHYLAHEVASAAVRTAAQLFLPALRASDWSAAQRVHYFIANSRCVQERIRECYGRESTVIHPPVEVDWFSVSGRDEGYYLVLARLVGYKAIDLAVRAFTRSGRRLVIVGDGPDRARLAALAGPTVMFAGPATREEVRRQVEGCRALVFPGLEDFGIASVEAQAAGKPVVAFGAGGALETVVEDVTGVFFREATPEALEAAVARCEARRWDPAAIRAHAEQFSEERFRAALLEFITNRR